jgi:hypothetical protein
VIQREREKERDGQYAAKKRREQDITTA